MKARSSATLAELAPNPNNPRFATEEALVKLKKSLSEFGDISGIVYNVRSKQLVGGHQRQKVLPPKSQIVVTERYQKPDKQGTVALGYVSTEDGQMSYREVDWSAEKEVAANLRANNPAGVFDDDAVVKLLQEIEGKVDFDLTGFTGEELVELVSRFSNLPEADTPFSNFDETAVNADGTVNFSFGTFRTKVKKDVYEAFSKHVMRKQGKRGGVLLDDIISELIAPK
jgi:hypothetical protein